MGTAKGTESSNGYNAGVRHGTLMVSRANHAPPGHLYHHVPGHRVHQVTRTGMSPRRAIVCTKRPFVRDELRPQ
jgi:hypothetical protein